MSRLYTKTECNDVGCIFNKNKCVCADVIELCPILNMHKLETKAYNKKLLKLHPNIRSSKNEDFCR